MSSKQQLKHRYNVGDRVCATRQIHQPEGGYTHVSVNPGDKGTVTNVNTPELPVVKWDLSDTTYSVELENIVPLRYIVAVPEKHISYYSVQANSAEEASQKLRGNIVEGVLLHTEFVEAMKSALWDSNEDDIDPHYRE